MLEVVHMDCLQGMSEMPEDSVDSIVTDPPYGLSFMGKEWDHGVPGSLFWEAALRVAKPGAHLLAFGGTRTFHRLACAIEDAGWEIRDCLMWVYGSGFPKSLNLKGKSQGWGTCLKPAWEPVLFARKSFSTTVEENLNQHGTGALNIDGCRIPLNGEKIHLPQSNPQNRKGVVGTDLGISNAELEAFQRAQRESVDRANQLGRWPANLIHDGDEEVTSLFPSSVSCSSPSDRKSEGLYRPGQGAYVKQGPLYPGDSGSAARFFYCAKASKADKEEGNTHPTVKPTTLMRYLCRLITPPGGLVFDPFAGSGSTGKAAALEGFEFLGFDINAEYVEIANRRLSAMKDQHDSSRKP